MVFLLRIVSLIRVCSSEGWQNSVLQSHQVKIPTSLSLWAYPLDWHRHWCTRGYEPEMDKFGPTQFWWSQHSEATAEMFMRAIGEMFRLFLPQVYTMHPLSERAGIPTGIGDNAWVSEGSVRRVRRVSPSRSQTSCGDVVIRSSCPQLLRVPAMLLAFDLLACTTTHSRHVCHSFLAFQMLRITRGDKLATDRIYLPLSSTVSPITPDFGDHKNALEG